VVRQAAKRNLGPQPPTMFCNPVTSVPAEDGGAVRKRSRTSPGDATQGSAQTKPTLKPVLQWLDERGLASLIRVLLEAVQEADRQIEEQNLSKAKASSDEANSLRAHQVPHLGLCRMINRLLELLVDLMSQFPTRRFSRLVVEDSNIILVVR